MLKEMDFIHIFIIWRGTPKTKNLFIKSCVFILTCLNVSHLQSSIWCSTPTEMFLLLFKFLNLLIWMPFSASIIFCFTSSTLGKRFPLRTFFIWGNKKMLLGQDQMNREGGALGSCNFWSKTAEYSVWCGQVWS